MASLFQLLLSVINQVKLPGTSSAGSLLTPLLTNPLILHLHHHFLQTRLAGSCAAELQAHTVFRK